MKGTNKTTKSLKYNYNSFALGNAITILEGVQGGFPVLNLAGLLWNPLGGGETGANT